MITLYDYWRSSAAYRLRIALGLLDLPYTAIPVNLLTGEHLGPEYSARNPQALVPTLEIDGLTLTQSLAVLEYLDEAHQAGFLPKDPAGRARTRALSYAIAMEIHPICNLSVARYAVDASAGAISMQGWMQHFITKGLTALERMLDTADTGRFCHGNSVSMADICLVPQMFNADRWGVDVTSFSRITAIIGNLDQIPAVRAAHPDQHQPKDKP
ncbi:MAG: maleylacetoacetate isomerase [Paracoccaceae bacterium]|nr:maleylacetoacetate isomerase [Paracoccaceae bacterium]